jgi:hypothetical protein
MEVIVKKVALLIIATVIISIMCAINYYVATSTGTTTNSYVVADSMIVHDSYNYSLYIKNTGATTDTITCKAYGFYKSWDGDSLQFLIDPDRYSYTINLADEETIEYKNDCPYYGIKIFVKSKTAGNHSTYRTYISKFK